MNQNEYRQVRRLINLVKRKERMEVQIATLNAWIDMSTGDLTAAFTEARRQAYAELNIVNNLIAEEEASL